MGVTGADGASNGVDVWVEGGCATGVVDAFTPGEGGGVTGAFGSVTGGGVGPAVGEITGAEEGWGPTVWCANIVKGGGARVGSRGRARRTGFVKRRRTADNAGSCHSWHDSVFGFYCALV